MPVSFSPGISVEYAGARWRVLRVLGAESVLLGSDAGEEVAADPLKIRLSDGGNLSDRPLDERRYSDADWSEVERRRDVLLALANRPTTSASVAAAAEALGLTPRRIWALLRHARMAGDDVAQFLPARNGPRKKRLGVSVEAIIQQAIDQHYAQRTRPDLNSLVAEIAGRCTAAGLRPPSPKAIKTRVRARDQAWLVRRREGWRKAAALRLLTGADPGAAAPWERVQIDSTPCDIRLVREHDRTVIGRPNITFAIDLYSRTILGFSVSLQSASTVTVATCLAHACLPKRDWLARRDLSSVHWPVWGKPVVLEYDQGPEHGVEGPNVRNCTVRTVSTPRIRVVRA